MHLAGGDVDLAEQCCKLRRGIVLRLTWDDRGVPLGSVNSYVKREFGFRPFKKGDGRLVFPPMRRELACPACRHRTGPRTQRFHCDEGCDAGEAPMFAAFAITLFLSRTRQRREI